MTNVHVWSPRRYKFEGLREALLEHPRLNNNIRSVKVHYRHSLTPDDLYEILTTALIEKGCKSVHIFVYDDDELEEGCGLETLEMSIKHLINTTKVHSRTYFLFADFVDFLYSDAVYSRQDLTRLKENVTVHVSQYPSRTFYKDFHGLIDGADCDCFNSPTEEGMKKLFSVFANVLASRSPIGAF